MHSRRSYLFTIKRMEKGFVVEDVEEVVQPVLYMHCSKMAGRVYVLIKSGWKSRRGGGGA